MSEAPFFVIEVWDAEQAVWKDGPSLVTQVANEAIGLVSERVDIHRVLNLKTGAVVWCDPRKPRTDQRAAGGRGMNFNLHTGDALDVLRTMADNSVDSIVTDPPYGISFMASKWDYDVPSEAIWAECLRVLKPGGHLLSFASTRTQHRMAVRIEDAGFEIRDMIAWAYGCLSADSEALTQRGWVRGTDLCDGDDVMQWNSETGELSWVQPSRVTVAPFSGELVRLHNRNTDQLLTPNHRVYAKIRRHSRRTRDLQYEVNDVATIKERSSAWRVTLPLAGVLAEGRAVIPEYAYLVGWWLTDAWAHGDGKACMFSQSKPATLLKLRTALAPYNPSEYVKKGKKPQHADEHTFYLTGDIATRLLAEHPKRELNWDVLTWNADARRALFRGLMDGDGSQPSGHHAHTFWSKNSERRDVFLALATSLGYRAHVGAKDCVFVNMKRATTEIQYKHKTETVPYEGVVWCVTVPHGAFVARRNGRPFITGNSGFPKSKNIALSIDKGEGCSNRGRAIPTASTYQASDTEQTNKLTSNPVEAYEARTEAGAAWVGWGTALKPAIEPITLARKPFKGTIAANVLEHGTAGLNIDGCRVATEDTYAYPNGPGGKSTHYASGARSAEVRPNPTAMHEQGRWPANLIHDGSEDVTNALSDASRFFYCSKASKKDREAGLEDFEQRTAGEVTGGRAEGSAGLNNPRAGAGRTSGARNHHPTVKPTDLMRYLCRLITPPGGTVLDPFMGAGSTGRAAVLEGFNFVGIDLDPEYVDIARARIDDALK